MRPTLTFRAIGLVKAPVLFVGFRRSLDACDGAFGTFAAAIQMPIGVRARAFSNAVVLPFHFACLHVLARPSAAVAVPGNVFAGADDAAVMVDDVFAGIGLLRLERSAR